jgi:lipid-A-disaccharide synthase
VSRPLKIGLIAGEASGDQLGFKLMRALRARVPDCQMVGVGGPLMEREGLRSLFPISDIAVMGILPVLARLPLLLRRIRETITYLADEKPDVLVIIDSPDFTHRVARQLKKQRLDLKVINYVSPTVWAWRPGRARTMKGYIDHVLALLPFEPAAYDRLDGPPCTYVGHPLIERLDELLPSPDEQTRRDQCPFKLLILPGSRRSEIKRLMPVFGAVLQALSTRLEGRIEADLPAVSHLRAEIEQHVATWPIKPRLLAGEADKYQAFRQARVALAASGTVTLELALSSVPQVVAYQVSNLEAQLRHFITVSSIVLPNLILDEPAFPEFLQEKCSAEHLIKALLPLFEDSAERHAQVAACQRLKARMHVPVPPSEKAVDVILSTLSGA